MITALLSRPVDLLLALGLPRTPQLPMLLSPKSPPPLELQEKLLLSSAGKQGGSYTKRIYRRREKRWEPVLEEDGTKQDRTTKSRPGQLSLSQYRHCLCVSTAFVGLNIINLCKDSMKLEQTCIYSVATNTQDTPKDKEEEGESDRQTGRQKESDRGRVKTDRWQCPNSDKNIIRPSKLPF